MRKTALLFPGQGAQYPGMGKSLYQASRQAREVFEEAGEALKIDLKKYIFEGTEEQLRQTEITQPAILTTSVAYFRFYLQEGKFPLPQYLAGHSLGEYTALCCAGALSLDQAVRLVNRRGQLMQEATGGAEADMIAVDGIKAEQVEEACAQQQRSGAPCVWIAAYNSGGQVVVAGHRQAVNEIAAIVKTLGAEIMPLKVSAAFHTPLMTPAADRLLETLSECTIAPLRCQVISNVTGLPYRNENEVKEGLYRQMTSPVQWAGSVEFLYRAGVYYFIDAGPRKLLRNQLKRQGWNAEYFALEAAEDITAFGNSIGSHLPALATPVNKALALAVSAKNYNYDDAGYEESVLSPFRKIKELLEKAELSGRVPVKEEMTEACGQLHRLLRGKRLQEEEITLQYDRLFTETGVLLVCPELKAALV